MIRRARALLSATAVVTLSLLATGSSMQAGASTATAPDAPTGVTAVAANKTANVSWTAPTNNGGSTITAFTVTSSPGAKTCTALVFNFCTVTGLTNDTAYTFTVTATNAIGTSSPSTPSSAVTPVGSAPTNPTNLTFTPANNSLQVSWSAPSAGGTGPGWFNYYSISSYTVTLSPGGATCTTSTLSCTITGLTNGTTYTGYVVATNSNKTLSSPSATATGMPASTPGAPTNVHLSDIGGNGYNWYIGWTPPSNTGGVPMSSYIVTSNAGVTNSSDSSVVATCTYVVASPEVDQCAVLDMKWNTSATFTVVGVNAAGLRSAASVPATIKLGTQQPGAASNVTASARNGAVVVAWTGVGYGSVSSYTVTATPGGKTCSAASYVATTCTVTGLTNGTAYTFVVTPVGYSTNGPDSWPTSPVTPQAGPPLAPTIYRIVPSSGAATISILPGDANGNTVTNFTVTASPGNGTCTATLQVNVTLASCSIAGLTNGSSYTFSAVTNSSGGTSNAAVSSTYLIGGVPAAPTAVIAAAGHAEATVGWTAPTETGGVPLTGYTVTSTPGSFTCTTSGETHCVVKGLTDNTSYTFKVKATNAIGSSSDSVASASVTASFAGFPAQAPTSVTGVAGDGQVTVSWSYNDMLTAQSFTVTASPDGATCFVITTKSCVVKGLTNGTAYTFTVIAYNSWGTSKASTASAAVTPIALKVPGAPTSVHATAGDGLAYVMWTAPTDTGGSAITGYTATASPGGKTCTATLSKQCTILALTNGTAYTFTVVATNAIGSSVSSDPSSAVTPVKAVPNTAPGAPAGVVATAGNGQAGVSWSAPSSNGGASITGYTVTSTPGSKTCTTTGSLSCTVTGLTNGTAYTFVVTATNSVGTSSPSTASTAVTPKAPTAPGAPTSVSTQVGNGQISVSWTAPTSDGGAAISSYTATSTPGNLTCTAQSGVSCVVSGLTNGTSYTFTVKAINSVGSSVASVASSPAVPRTSPGIATGVTGVAGNTSVVVSWTAPTSNGGSVITGYTVTSTPDGKTCTTAGSLNCTVSGLTNGTGYTFTVVATNAAGSGSNSSPSSTVTPLAPTRPGAPASASATPGNGTATINWQAPTSTGGSPITGYTVTSSPDSKTCTTSGLTCVISGLTNGIAYTFSVVATNSVGSGTATSSSAITPRTVPGAPTSVVGIAASKSVKITWVAPTVTGGSPITGYQVLSAPGAKVCTTTGALTCVVLGLTPNVPYTFTVVAINAAGSSVASKASLAVKPKP